ncbi:unnamed protein product [Caenorhabditis brenneri]
MKLVVAITCLVFCALGVSSHGIRAKRGLSADEQKKLLDVLNKDRQDVGKRAGVSMNIVQYDVALEKKTDSAQCGKNESGVFSVPLQLGSEAQQLYKILVNNGYSITSNLFWPTVTKIGCSKTKTCSVPFGEKQVATFGEKFRGKASTFQGACLIVGTQAELDDNILLALNKIGLPHPSKYGDLLGVPKPMEENEVGTSATITSSGNAFHIVLLLFSVFISFFE